MRLSALIFTCKDDRSEIVFYISLFRHFLSSAGNWSHCVVVLRSTLNVNAARLRDLSKDDGRQSFFYNKVSFCYFCNSPSLS
jgi:hypothetical protein